MAERVVAALADGLWQGALLALGVSLLLRVFRFNATTRYVVWSGTLLAVMALPMIAGRYTPPMEIPDLSAPSSFAEPMHVAPVALVPPSSAATAIAPLPTESFELELPAGWSSYVLLVWLFVSLILLLRLARASVSLRRLKQSVSAADDESIERLRNWEEACGAGRAASLLVSPRVGTPMALGWNRPAILLPAALTEQLTRAELDQVLLHELAHLRRWDDWTKLAQRLAEAIFFFHPAIYWIARNLNLEREVACDDWVVVHTGRTKPYALCLTRLVETARGYRHPALASGALKSGKQLSWRIEMLLNKDRDASPRVQKNIVWVTAIILGAGLAASAWISPLVAASKASGGNEARPSSMPAFEEPSIGQEEQARELQAREQERVRLAQLAAMDREAAERDAQLALAAAQREAEVANHVREIEMLERQQIYVRQDLARIEAQRPEPFVVAAPRVHTLRALEPVIAEEELLPLMAEIAKNDNDPAVPKAALGQLATAGGEAGAEALIALYDVQDPDIKKFVVRSLARNATRPAVEKLKAIATSEPTAELRLDAVRYLGALARSPKGKLASMPIPDLAPVPMLAPPAPVNPPKAGQEVTALSRFGPLQIRFRAPSCFRVRMTAIVAEQSHESKNVGRFLPFHRACLDASRPGAKREHHYRSRRVHQASIGGSLVAEWRKDRFPLGRRGQSESVRRHARGEAYGSLRLRTESG